VGSEIYNVSITFDKKLSMVKTPFFILVIQQVGWGEGFFEVPIILAFKVK
jgi:hypothetical protein